MIYYKRFAPPRPKYTSKVPITIEDLRKSARALIVFRNQEILLIVSCDTTAELYTIPDLQFSYIGTYLTSALHSNIQFATWLEVYDYLLQKIQS